MIAKSPWQRRLCFLPAFGMRMLVLGLRCFDIGGGEPNAMQHVILQVPNRLLLFPFSVRP